MGGIYDECIADLDRWRETYRGQPQQEMVRLWLLALERESIVSVTYREDLIEKRLEKLPVPKDVQEMIRYALLWAWKDEEMHAIYIRGALFQSGGLWQRLNALTQQVSGGIGGWASSVQQNLMWREAPFSRALATLLTFIGILGGKVSQAVRGQLRYHSFLEFCQFNVDAERTAVLVWKRLSELARENPEIVKASATDFDQMKEDEDRHARVFEIFANALTEDDHLKPGVTAESLRTDLLAVSEYFLPPSKRPPATVGSGGEVFVRTGEPGTKLEALRKILDDADASALLARRAEQSNKTVAELTVAIKISFMMGYHESDRSPLTDPSLVDELCKYLEEKGVASIVVLEGTNHYDNFYEHRTVPEVADYFGIRSARYRLVDASKDQTPHEYRRGMAQYAISRTWRDADVRISFGKLRTHPTEMAFLTMRNLEGISARSEQFLFAERQAHLDAALTSLLTDFPPHLALLDAFECAADGVAGILGSAHPKDPHRLYAGADCFSVDIVAMRHAGISRPLATFTLQETRQWFGDPTAAIVVRGDDTLIAGWRSPRNGAFTTFLAAIALPFYVLFSGRGAIFVPEMDEAAFPSKTPPGLFLRTARSITRRILGLQRAR